MLARGLTAVGGGLTPCESIDLRNFLITILAVVVAASLMFVFVENRTSSPEENEISYDFSKTASSKQDSKDIPLSARITSGKLSEVRDEIRGGADEIFVPKSTHKVRDYMKAADENLEKALSLTEYDMRHLLIDQIYDYDKNLKKVLSNMRDAEGIQSDILIFVANSTAYHLFSWSPLYYYIHREAQGALKPLMEELKEQHIELINELASFDEEQAGTLATKDIELYIEDIRKSAARRNSDFIKFSYEDYLRYREFFNELIKIHPDSFLGFAASANILFDDFYAMHEEVDSDYSDKTRGYVEDMRLDMRDMHKQALLRLREVDESSASIALEKTISAIEEELQSHDEWRRELHDIMKDDLSFYNAIKNDRNN